MYQGIKPLRQWEQVANKISGEELPCGHYKTEEAPNLLLAYVSLFFRTDAGSVDVLAFNFGGGVRVIPGNPDLAVEGAG
ncbi:MAG: hypothetical protein H7293_14230 [Candidatus Saccharibacteria bacterium]|nr:hypothetical protein [Rhodoferax sp.]